MGRKWSRAERKKHIRDKYYDTQDRIFVLVMIAIGFILLLLLASQIAIYATGIDQIVAFIFLGVVILAALFVFAFLLDWVFYETGD